ncbi:hypothetical protein VNO80_08780 [Phaseolus coccineus]|uniref:Uncharacterized protein n=1 Tax=Phaseolus coccineus TaxID=3886 RepID=A0AAN9RHQ1_PHACN
MENKICGRRFEARKKKKAAGKESDVGPVVIINIGTRVNQIRHDNIRVPPRNHWHPLLASSSLTPISCGPHLSFIFFPFSNFAFILEPTNGPFFLSYHHHQLTLASETSRNNKNLPSPPLSQPLIFPLPTVFLVLRWAGDRSGIHSIHPYQTDQVYFRRRL